MTKDELVAKRTLALKELKDIEEALNLDEHYIDILEGDIRNKKLAIKNRNAEIKKLKKQLELEMSVNGEFSAIKKLRELEKDKAYLDESLDKQIQATLDLQKENKDLEWQLQEIAKDNENYQNENAELKEKLDNWVKCADLRLANWQKYEKENAELKKQIEKMKCCYNCAKDCGSIDRRKCFENNFIYWELKK